MNLIPLRPGLMGGAEVYFRDLLAELLRMGGHEYVLVTADYNHHTLPPDSAACRRILFHRELDLDGQAAGAARAGLHRARHLADRFASWYDLATPPSARPWIERALARLQPVAGAATRAVGRGRVRRRYRAGWSLRALVEREGIDVWFCPFTNLEPRLSSVPAVITVFDLQHEAFPEFFAPDELAHRRRYYPRSCAAADHVIAISEFTRQGIIERYGVPAERVSAIWLAAGSDFDGPGAAERVAAVRARHALPARYALYPANTWHHKNHRRLVDALARHRRAQGSDLALVLTGAPAEGQRALEAAIPQHGLERAVRILGYVPRADMAALYAGAMCLVLPSLFEGFGIPLVEAMLAGCPIAAARATSVPEVVGDAAVLFDPLDADDIARVLTTLESDPALRAELSRRGRARAALFSVRRMAEATLGVLERAAREAPAARARPGGEHIAVEGVYADAWMGAEGVVLLAGRFDRLEVEGELPSMPQLLPQSLTVDVPGREAVVVPLPEAGPFAFSVPLAASGRPAALEEVWLWPSRTVCPRRHGWSDDGRELSLQLRRVRARAEDGRDVVAELGEPVGAPP